MGEGKKRISGGMKTAVHIAAMEWRNLFCSTKIFVLGILLIFFNEQIVRPLRQCSGLMIQKVSCFEPYAALCNSGAVMLVLPLFYLSMMADFPKEGGISLFFHIRCSRLAWLLGELLFVILSIFTLVFYMMAAGILLILPCGQWILHFSDAVTKYISVFPDRAGDYVTQLLPENLYNQIPLREVMLHSTALLALYLAMLALVLLLFTLVNHKKAGIFLDGILILFGVVSCGMHLDTMWMFPMANTVVWLHYTGYLAEPVYPVWASYLYFGIADITLIICCITVRKRYQIRA